MNTFFFYLLYFCQIFFIFNVKARANTCEVIFSTPPKSASIMVEGIPIEIYLGEYSIAHSKSHFLETGEQLSEKVRMLKGKTGFLSTSVFPDGVSIEHVFTSLLGKDVNFYPDSRFAMQIKTLGFAGAYLSAETVGLNAEISINKQKFNITVVICSGGPCTLPGEARALNPGDVVTIIPLRGKGVYEVKWSEKKKRVILRKRSHMSEKK